MSAKKRVTDQPWFVWKGHAKVMFGTPSEHSAGIVNGHEGTICTVDDLDFSETQTKALARFIAAAPDMRRAIIALLAAVWAEDEVALADAANAAKKVLRKAGNP